MKDVGIFCVIDCRVSDPQQLKGGSLDDQEAICRLTASKMAIQVAKVFKKPHSATTTEREDFEEIITFIKKDSRDIKYYIVKSLDRLTREGYVEYLRLKSELEKIHVTIVDAQGVIQEKKNTLEHLGVKYPWSVYSPSEAGEMLETYKGKAEARDILTRLIGAEVKLVQDGYVVRGAPDGLKNKSILVDGKKKNIREASDRSHYFIKMFQLRSEGKTDLEIINILNSIGFKTRTQNRWDRTDKEHPKVIGRIGGKPLTIKKLQQYIAQTEYAGINSEKWNKHSPVKMKGFDGIVSIDTFNKANKGKVYIQVGSDGKVEVLHNYSSWGKIKRMRDNPLYPWKCILCPICSLEMLASASKGKSGNKFGGYHCGGSKNGKRAHPYLRIRKEIFENSIQLYLERLKFKEGFLNALEMHLVTKYREKEKEIVTESSNISRNISDLKAELANKLTAFGLAESLITRRMLEEQIETLYSEIKKVESERGEIEFTEKSIRSFIKHAKEVMEHPGEILTDTDSLENRRYLLNLFFEEIPNYNQIVNGTPKLQPLFRLSEEFKNRKSDLVTLRGIEPRFKP